MRYKKQLYFLVFLLFSFTYIGFISAACTGGPTQIILNLSYTSNAHGSIGNQPTYTTQICYDSIFGSAYLGANPHTCTGNNGVLRLSATTNAHAQNLSSTGYTTNVCYGNLECTGITSGNCAANYKNIVNLSALTNAHLSITNSPGYPVKICCKLAIQNDITDLYFSDMSFNLVPVNRIDTNDQVKLVVRGNNLQKNIQYTIYRDNDAGTGVSQGNFVSSVIVAGQADNFAYYIWKPDSFSAGQYIFEASVAGGPWAKSWIDNLSVPGSVLTVTAPDDNSDPIANIIIPTNGEIYFKNQVIKFNQSSYDIDDVIDYTWDFGDGTPTVSGDTETMANYNTTHSYSTAGTKTINLMVTDERTKTAFDSVSILVLDEGNWVFANISKPQTGERIVNEVEVSPNGTYGINVANLDTVTNPPTADIKCLGGGCPTSLTIGGGGGSILITDDLSPNQKRNIYSMFNFEVLFDDGFIINRGWTQESENFKRASTQVGQRNIKLNATYHKGLADEINGSASVTFYFALRNTCTDNKNKWWDNDGFEHNTLSTTNVDYCDGINNIIGDVDDCCPAGYKCEDNAGKLIQEKVCVLDLSSCNITRCEDFATEIACEADTCFNRTSIALGGSVFNCANIQFLSNSVRKERCVWTNGACKLNVTTNISGTNTDTDPDTDYEHSCNEIQSPGECVEGRMTVSLDKEIIWDPNFISYVKVKYSPNTFEEYLNNIDNLDPECQYWIDSCSDQSALVICGENLVKLPFFGFIQFILTVIAIGIIYFIILFKKDTRLRE